MNVDGLGSETVVQLVKQDLSKTYVLFTHLKLNSCCPWRGWLKRALANFEGLKLSKRVLFERVLLCPRYKIRGETVQKAC